MKVVTLRSHLSGALTDIVEDTGLQAFPCSLVCELVDLVIDYHEEGTPLFVDAFITNDLDRLTQSIPSAFKLPLGKTTLDADGIRRAVKRAAPLCKECWKIFFEIKRNALHYGVFRDSGNILNVPLDIVLEPGDTLDPVYLRVSNVGTHGVKIVNHRGDSKLLKYTNDSAEESEPTQALSSLVEAVCGQIDMTSKDTCRSFLMSTLTYALRGAHGALVAVSANNQVPHPLRECVRLNPPIDIVDTVERARQQPEQLAELHALEMLIRGMFTSDGIVVFDRSAKILAYNAFVKAKATAVTGGARKRAFQALLEIDSTKLYGAFIESQDGASDYRNIL